MAITDANGGEPTEKTSPVPRIDVIVAVHNASRPVERAVASVLRPEGSVGVVVVAHNVAAAEIRERLGVLADAPGVRVVELADGVRSPANAFNRGLDAAAAEFVTVVGSDDALEPGALEDWLSIADRDGADVVMAPIRRVGGGVGTVPRVRPGRVRDLDGDRDRLFERAAPLGLIRRSTFPTLRYTEGIPRGVDQAYGLHLWFAGARVSFDPAAGAYLEHDDQQDRVTKTPGPLADDLPYLGAIETDAAFEQMTPAARRAVAAKLVRVHLIGAIASRARGRGLTVADREAVRTILQRLSSWAPGLTGLLARRDRRALREALRSDATSAEVTSAVGDRSRFMSISALVTVNPLRVLHRHAPLRSQLAARRVGRLVAAAAGRSRG